MRPNPSPSPQDPSFLRLLETYEVHDVCPENAVPEKWHRDYPDWSQRRPGQQLDGNALCRLLAELDDKRRHGRTLDVQLMKHVVDCIQCAPSISLRIEPRGWRDIAATQRVLRDDLLLTAAGYRSMQAATFRDLCGQLMALTKPKMFARAETIALTPAAVAAQGPDAATVDQIGSAIRS